MEKLRILGIAGSLRKGSFNKMLLNAAAGLVPPEVELEIVDLEGIEPFNQDRENNPNDKLKELKKKIGAADGILIATPEYNYSIPGVLKNAIDAVSRPYGTNPFEGKPIALMGASIGMLGTGRAQYHLRQSFVFLNGYVLNRPEIMVPFAEQKFDVSGNLLDERTKGLIGDLFSEFIKWIHRLR
ncbi:MAG: NADPH-dependent FMN reductase [Syntrophorhabdaceae bacterium]